MWRKAKKALGLSLCFRAPSTLDGASPSDHRAVAAIAHFSKPGSDSLEETCAVCQSSMISGEGYALFTAECSHTFHFNCIVSNVKHGNLVCPICRAKWKETPLQCPTLFDHPHGRININQVNSPHHDYLTTSLNGQVFQAQEPSVFDDDDPLDLVSEMNLGSTRGCTEPVEIETYPEFSALEQSVSEENFTILIHVKSPVSIRDQSSRAPLDLVTVLDVSDSMSGIKLELLKHAMGFVIQNLGPSDRLSVVTFSTDAQRIFHLRHMSESGQRYAMQAIDSLSCGGGTDIVGGLRKGARVIQERKEKNPICSIILLSDGQDLVYPSDNFSMACLTPVHAFGFGYDHDSVTMHAIAENSGGTFSYIENESKIQDAFAQCIAGLLSVVVQEIHVDIETVHLGVHINKIKSGSYTSIVSPDGLWGSILVGHLYAEEERDFLVSVTVPPASEKSMPLLKVDSTYQDPFSKEIVQVEHRFAEIERPVLVIERMSSIEVDRQRNRLLAAEAMAEARTAAERGDLRGAMMILKSCRRLLSESQAGRAGDWLCMSLDAELKEVQDRMANQHEYETSGRAYILSGMSSHLLQRATTRGDSTNRGSLVQAYQTSSMVDMLQKSQNLGLPLELR